MAFESEAIKLQIMWFCGPESKQVKAIYISFTPQTSESSGYPSHPARSGSTVEGLALGRGAWPPGESVLPQLSSSCSPGITCCWVDRSEDSGGWPIEKQTELLDSERCPGTSHKNNPPEQVNSQRKRMPIGPCADIIWSNPILWSRNCLQFTF